jgi:uncharacterized repeat protein (TIGR01451 family)
MNTASKATLSSRVGKFFANLCGRIQWTSPPWAQFLRRQAQTQPGRFWASSVFIILCLVGMAFGYIWHINQPQPVLTIATITPPKITPIVEDTLVPDVLTIDFGLKEPGTNENAPTPQSVAPLKRIGQVVESGITLSPEIKGEWRWQTDSHLVFTPGADWPAGQTYTIHFDKTVFSEQAKMKRYTETFTTHPFEAKISELKLYQDPINAELRAATATILFNFPVDTTSVQSHVQLMLQALKKGQLDLKAQQYPFTLTFDKLKRTAFLRSANLSLPNVSRYLLLALDKGIQSATHSDASHEMISKNLLIPDRAGYFKVLAANASIVRNTQDRPEQVLILETSIGVTEAALKGGLHVYVLPDNYPATVKNEEIKQYAWQNPGEVTDAIIALSSPLKLDPIVADQQYATLHSFQFKAQTPHYLYVKLDKGTKAFGDFPLSSEYVAVIKVPELPKEITFLHKGSLLALSGEKKLSVLLRGIGAVKFDFARVLPENVNQLVTQTEGNFNNPIFINKSFNQQNISEITSEIQTFDSADLSKQQYTALDFAKYLATETQTAGPHGLFLLQAQEWDNEKQIPLETKATRLVLITDLGLLVKDNLDGSHEVFVQSVTKGTPQAEVNVSILGRNGLPLLTIKTNEQGQASFPNLSNYTDDREPVVYLATLNNDVSFIPYRNATGELNYTRFDIGGTYTNPQAQHPLSAYLFSDRGIYRPGDVAKIGMIVKQANVNPQPAGLPLQATVIDPRGMTIIDQMLTVDALGYLTLDVPTQPTAPTGHYQIYLYTVKDKQPDSLIGSTSIQVAEFQPDRMRIQSSFNHDQADGWVSPTDLTAQVKLLNLYGAPATDRQVQARLLLEPKPVIFKKYPNFFFVDPLLDPKKPAKILTDSLTEVKTNDQGEVTIPLHLERFEKATYQLTFFAEGFESGGGRSVGTQAKILVSPLPYFVGYKADGDLKFIKQNSQRSLQWIAIDPKLKQLAVKDLSLQVVAITPISTLVKRPDGTYQYQSILQNKIIQTKPLDISTEGTAFELPTAEIGDYAINIIDKNQTELSHVAFSVVGTSKRPLAKNAELDVKLDKEIYHAGEDITLQITAPFKGAGIITLERDKIYATQWFKIDATNAMQTVHIPSDFQGNGYVNVAFVRDWNSPNIFTSPLSYNVTPFAVDHDAHALHIDLSIPKEAQPGKPFTMTYQSDKPGKVIVFAVDEGILQVANYQTPDPLGFFFEKQALQVLTQQTLDQILPQFIQDRERSAAGGDSSAALLKAHLNPFRRKTDLPIAYWSGIVDTDSTPRQLTYNIPDYFNGTIRVMAVAVSEDAVGAAETQVEVRGHFVINPNTPTFVSPGDEFEITASIANNVKGSGKQAKISVQLVVTPELQLQGSHQQTLVIDEDHEQTTHFKIRALSKLGSAMISLKAQLGDKSSSIDTTLSVRPAMPYLTTVTSGQSQQTRLSVPLDRHLYPEDRLVEASLSSSPLILVAGLQRYLENFPYGCTEQLTSKVFPLLALGNQPWFASDLNKVTEKIMGAIQMLAQRQMSNGGFSYWPGVGDNASNAQSSVYAMHFLTDAAEQGYYAPSGLFNSGINYLKEVAAQNPTNADEARTEAYAIYLLTRNEIITTNYLTNLQLYLDKEQPKIWQADLTGAYIASTYQLLKNQSEAERLISQFKPQKQSTQVYDFYSQDIANAQYLYLVARHFTKQLAKIGEPLVMELVTNLNSGEINTLLSSYASLALNAYVNAANLPQAREFSIREGLEKHEERNLASVKQAYAAANLSGDTLNVIFGNPKHLNFFYQLTQAGFDKTLPKEPLQQGLDVYREYRDKEGKAVETVVLGNEIEVHIQIRALDNRDHNNIAITDLLPGGFEVISDSVTATNMDYADVREDRVVFFGSADPAAKEIIYRIKATNIGRYTIPAILAESMYDAQVKAQGIAGTITIEGRTP